MPPCPARRLLVIHNPTAGRSRTGLLLRVLDRLTVLGCKITLYKTKAPRDATLFLRDTNFNAYDAVVASGGDGTIREVVDGLHSRPLPLGILPLGTANVLAGELGLTSDYRLLSDVIAFGQPAPIYVAEANGQPFLIMAGVGFDARVVEGVNMGLKRVAGKAAYVASALAALARHRASLYKVEIDGTTYTAAAVIIAKGHYYAGRFVIANAAQLSEPMLQIALFTKGGRRDLMHYAIAVATGQLHTLPDVRIVPGREVRIEGADEQFQADGDVMGRLPIFATVAARPLVLLR